MIADIKSMGYWELRKEISKLIPRMTQFLPETTKTAAVKEKGRKSGYRQYNIRTGEMVKQERLLNTEEVSSFLEISIRAAACPMPFNIDIWDGLLCPFGCKYCFADAFRASLYTAFFDNSKSMGVRHCRPDYYKRELDKLFEKVRGADPLTLTNDIQKAIAMEIPMRMGIRFEDFIAHEKRAGVSLAMIKYLSENDYPLMINTKSALPGEDTYAEALGSNKAGSAIHFTMISCDEDFLKKVEPGAPSFRKRIQAAKNLVEAGVRVVARIEPFLIFLTDEPDMVLEYIEWLHWAGIQNITFDTYSYSANNPGIRSSFRKIGMDFDRFFTLGCDSQALGSILLEKFMEVFQNHGFSCSTFDLGCAGANSQTICCEVGDFFENSGFNYGSSVGASRYIISQKGKPVTWKMFEDYVISKGGFLSEKLKAEVKGLWNMEGNSAYFINWSAGVEPYGRDHNGIVWRHKADYDFREEVVKGVI